MDYEENKQDELQQDMNPEEKKPEPIEAEAIYTEYRANNIQNARTAAEQGQEAEVEFEPSGEGGGPQIPDGADESQKPKRKKLKWKKLNPKGKKILSVVLIVVLCAGAGFGGGLTAVYLNGSGFSVNNVTINPDDDINTAAAVAEKVIPSVVGISTSTKVTYQSWTGQEEGYSTGVGTGIIIDEDGYILTNSHVIDDGGADTIVVSLYDGRELDGTVLWYDETIDLAIVKVDATGLTAAELGDSDDIQIGDYAIAIGNPLGLDFERSVTQGVISGLNRSITIEDGQSSVTMDDLIQTDAAINSGNSGGPLLNAAGQVIGINSAKAQDGESLGFAIPINTAIPIIESVLENGSFQRAYLGIKGGSVADYLEAYPDADLGTETGVYVSELLSNSPAGDAGIQVGDVIVAVEDDEIQTISGFITTLLQYEPGDSVNVEVLRNGKTLHFTVTLTTESE